MSDCYSSPPAIGNLWSRVIGDACLGRTAATTASVRSVAAAGLMALFVAAPALGADVIRGAQVYARHCAACHGPKGMSTMPGAPHLARGERLLQSDAALLASVRAGRNAMPAYVGILTDREILDVIAYSRTLR